MQTVCRLVFSQNEVTHLLMQSVCWLSAVEVHSTHIFTDRGNTLTDALGVWVLLMPIYKNSTRAFTDRGNILTDALCVLVLLIPIYKNSTHTHSQTEVTHLLVHSVCGSY